MKIKIRILLIFLIIIIIPSIIIYFILLYSKSSLIIDYFMSLIIILIGIAFVMIYWIYSRIIFPILKLHEAINKIKEGNFDSKLDFNAYDELGELAQDFEEMRIKLKKNEEQRILQAKNSKEIISNLSHDLKTPITAIKAYVEGLIDNVASSEQMKDKYIRTIYNKANDMDKLIDELSFYSKIENNDIPYNYRAVDIVEFFKVCISEIKLDMDALGIEFHFVNDINKSTYVLADVEQMKRVINNIISNSIKYRDKFVSKICICLIDEMDFVKIEISDNGRGIPSEDLPYIFDRFYQTNTSKNSLKSGSGLGLSIVKKIIEDHGGKVWAKSILGSGTDIIIILKKYQERVDYE